KSECFKSNNTGQFAKECPSKGTNDGKKRDSFYQDEGAGKKEQNQNCLLTMDDGVVNWGEHTVDYEEEMNFSVFNCSKEDSVGKPLYSRFTKTNDFKGVPHPLSGDYTPKPQEEIDESLYVYGKKGPQEPEPSVSDDRSSEYSTCQSNDSAGSIGTSSEHSVDLESEISREELECYDGKRTRGRSVQLNAGRPNINSVRPNINTGRTNINSVRPNINTGRTNINSVRPNINTGRINVNLVRPRVNTVLHKMLWILFSLSVELTFYRTNVNPVRPRVNTGSFNVNIVRSRQPVPTKTSNRFSPKRPQVNQLNQRRHFSKSHSPVSRPIVRNTARMTYSHAVKGNWRTAVKTSAVQDQTVLGKDYSNLLIADSLLKTIWFINAPCYGNEALASPKANGVCLGDDASKQGRINDIVADEDITLILKLIIKQLKM
ncbi:hypothetical protein Tco_1063042, partial [Tanacetum coccineum]